MLLQMTLFFFMAEKYLFHNIFFLCIFITFQQLIWGHIYVYYTFFYTYLVLFVFISKWEQIGNGENFDVLKNQKFCFLIKSVQTRLRKMEKF